MTYNRTGGLNKQEWDYVQQRKKEVLANRNRIFSTINLEKESHRKDMEKQVWIERTIGKKITFTQYEMIKRFMRDNLF